jgi:maltose alpha-D-glucosyltransferase/alpha-amylase
MSFHFPLMPRMYMAIAQEDRFPITDIIRQTPSIPPNCQWAVFLRNHDELTLEMVTSRERDYLWSVYAADPRARINLGIRRRLAPLLERDRRRIELMTSLLLSMPGTPVLYYGDELGMGDNIHLGDRDGVRTPMQWAPDRNGGFSRADPERLPLPVLMGPLYGYEAVNVEAQQRDPHSLLNWTRRLLAKRRQTHAFGRGALRFLLAGNRKILAYMREWNGSTILCVANLANSAQPVELPLQAQAGRVPVEMLGGEPFPAIGELPYLLTLPPYGFYWFDLSAQASPPSWHAGGPPQMPELITLVLRPGAGLSLAGESRHALETEVLPGYLARQRWHPAHVNGGGMVRLDYAQRMPAGNDEYYWVELVDEIRGTRHLAPLALLWDDEPDARYPIARVRRGARVGSMADAFLQPGFVLELMACLRRGDTLAGPAGGEIRFHGTPALAELEPADPPALQWIDVEQSNSSVVIDEEAILKLMRNPSPGISPEVEMAAHLARLGYANTPAFLGTVERVSADGEVWTLALLHRYLLNEGDAWNWTLGYLKRTLANALLSGNSPDDFEADLKGYAAFAGTMGRRLAELHNLMARPCDDPAFAARLADSADAARTRERVLAQLRRAEEALRERLDELEEPSRACALWLIEHRERLERLIERLAESQAGAPLLRGHGDFHLGQVLVAGADAYLIDFEGEPLAEADARRELASPAKDVAGMLRSFDYAAAAASWTDPLVPAPADANAGAQQGEPPQAVPEAVLRDALLSRFREYASQAFLDGYRGTREDTQALDPAREAGLLQLAQLEKAAYELCYECAHRPDWISLPLRALAELARSALLAEAIDAEGGGGA